MIFDFMEKVAGFFIIPFSVVFPFFGVWSFLRNILLFSNTWKSKVVLIVLGLLSSIGSLILTFLGAYIFAISTKNVNYVIHILFFAGVISIYQFYRKRFITGFFVFKVTELILLIWASGK